MSDPRDDEAPDIDDCTDVGLAQHIEAHCDFGACDIKPFASAGPLRACVDMTVTWRGRCFRISILDSGPDVPAPRDSDFPSPRDSNAPPF